MSSPLDAIAMLRRFAENPGDAEAAAWVAERFRSFLDGEVERLDDAFTLRPGRGCESWRTVEMRARRDRVVKEWGEKFGTGRPIAAVARELCSAATRYQSGRWRHDRVQPRDYSDPRNRALLALLATTEGRVPSEATLRRVLGGVDAAHEMPDFKSSEPCSNTPTED